MLKATTYEMDQSKIYHVIPIDDLKGHSGELTETGTYEKGLFIVRLTSQCECKPRIEYEGEGAIVVHNSFDGREGVEWVNELLK